MSDYQKKTTPTIDITKCPRCGSTNVKVTITQDLFGYSWTNIECDKKHFSALRPTERTDDSEQ